MYNRNILALISILIWVPFAGPAAAQSGNSGVLVNLLGNDPAGGSHRLTIREVNLHSGTGQSGSSQSTDSDELAAMLFKTLLGVPQDTNVEIPLSVERKTDRVIDFSAHVPERINTVSLSMASEYSLPLIIGGVDGRGNPLAIRNLTGFDESELTALTAGRRYASRKSWQIEGLVPGVNEIILSTVGRTGVALKAVSIRVVQGTTTQSSGLPGSGKSGTKSSRSDSVSLNKEDWRKVQIGLWIEGFDPGNPDGIPGRRTRDAIGKWQQSMGLASTGYLDAEQADTLKQLSISNQTR